MPTPAELDRAATRRDQVYDLIADSLATRGYPPTIRELVCSTGVSSLTIRHDLDRLVRDGRIERDPGIARSIRLL